MTHVGSVLQPSSPEAASLAQLFVIVHAIGAGIFILVTGFIAYIVIRWRARAGDGEPPQTAGHRGLEVVWTIGPVLIVAALFGLSARAMSAADSPSGARDADLVVIGHQWWWEVRYPGSPAVTTANEIHIPVGRLLRVRLESADVIHDFWVPQLGRKMDMVPGHPNEIPLQARAPGVYEGACAEFCGIEHAWMRLRVVAESPDAFEAWRRAQASTPAATAPPSPGARLFQRLTCVNCHTIAGTPAAGTAGPDLTHLASRATLAAGVLANTPESLARWLHDPQAIKPGSLMPNFRLRDGEVRDLVAYLGSLR